MHTVIAGVSRCSFSVEILLRRQIPNTVFPFKEVGRGALDCAYDFSRCLENNFIYPDHHNTTAHYCRGTAVIRCADALPALMPFANGKCKIFKSPCMVNFPVEGRFWFLYLSHVSSSIRAKIRNIHSRSYIGHKWHISMLCGQAFPAYFCLTISKKCMQFDTLHAVRCTQSFVWIKGQQVLYKTYSML